MELQYDRPGHAIGTVNEVTIEGFCLPVPPSNLIFITAPGGFLGCGFFDMRTFARLGMAAVRITGVSTLEELLAGKIAELTESAETLGIKVGMTGYDALLHICSANPHL
ncbi:YunC family protein [uncultured Methanocorpusculum sp.]|nr:YunC family protein [uncultured Methanocorpusculum sp.]